MRAHTAASAPLIPNINILEKVCSLLLLVHLTSDSPHLMVFDSTIINPT